MVKTPQIHVVKKKNIRCQLNFNATENGNLSVDVQSISERAESVLIFYFDVILSGIRGVDNLYKIHVYFLGYVAGYVCKCVWVDRGEQNSFYSKAFSQIKY